MGYDNYLEMSTGVADAGLCWITSYLAKVDAMFAVIEDGSRQYKVQAGDLLVVDYRDDVEAGQALIFDKVLIANAGGASVIGKPTIEGATVSAEVVVGEFKGPKLEIQKFRRRHASRRHTGHRQKHTRVKIIGINVPNLAVVETPAS